MGLINDFKENNKIYVFGSLLGFITILISLNRKDYIITILGFILIGISAILDLTE